MYPSPSHSAHIWLSGNSLCLGLPAQEGHQQGNTIQLPATPAGLTAALKILRQREAQGRPRSIGTPGVPTQALAEALAKSPLKPWREDLPKDPQQALEELGF